MIIVLWNRVTLGRGCLIVYANYSKGDDNRANMFIANRYRRKSVIFIGSI